MKNYPTKHQQDFIKIVGSRVKELRTKQKISQIKLSLKISEHYSLISKVELGKNITISTLILICDSLNVSPKDFFNSDMFK